MPKEKLNGIIYNNNPKIDRFIFICGLHRSGTTLLERLLVSKFELSCLRASVPESEGQHMQNVYSAGKEFGGVGRFALNAEMQHELDTLTDYKRHFSDIMARWNNFIVGSSNVLIEKSPPNLTKIGWLRRVFNNAKFLILTRDPRAVSAATQKMAKTQTSLPEMMLNWNAAYSLAKKDFMCSDCYYVKYEDICESTDIILDNIASFANIEYRKHELPLESRFCNITNTNNKYITMHASNYYGDAVWNELGYCIATPDPEYSK